MKEFTFIDLFSGIGGFHQAATQNGGKCIYASEIDEHAKNSYYENYGLLPAGDIEKENIDNIPTHDLLLAGFPCQPFSIIGQQKGFRDTRGTLFFSIEKILENKKPPMLVLENVKQLATHDKGNTLKTILNKLKNIGYKVDWKVLNALDYGLPQKRERTIIVGFLDHATAFKWPEKTPQFKPLDKILDKKADKRFRASDYIQEKRKLAHKSKHKLAIWHENKSGNVSSYPYSCALRAGASYNYLLVNGERRLTPREMLRLQGFPESFKIVCSDSQTRKQAGNAVPVPMIRAVIQEVINAKTKTQRLQKTQGARFIPTQHYSPKQHIGNL